MIKVNDKYFEDYISNEELKVATDRISKEIFNDHNDFSKLVVIGVLNGAVPFMNDIVFKLPKEITIDYVKVSSYGDDLKSSGDIKLLLDTKIDLNGKDVLIVDDIIDSGQTQKFLKNHFIDKFARSVKTCFLFYKDNISSDKPDYSGIKIDDEFIIGYGLDYAQKGRNIDRVLKLVK